ncbi:GntR family transcriptional regulator [Nonomuraea purpurea]|uniref:GntR family transcriptional regulator n=1 Tax=Nonomuraea purpurea TaxID=1849276 RepID=A0ABV8G3F8_9ACTN
MTFTVPPTRGEAAARQLRAEIVSGVLRPGEVIKDAEIASRLNLSITPVREAIAQLVTEGLIEAVPNRVRRVAPVTRESAIEVIDVMGVLGGAALERALPALTPDLLARMRAELEAMNAALAGHDSAAATATGTRFTLIMVHAAGNGELEALWNLVIARAQRLMMLTAASGFWPLWQSGYGETLALLEAGDTAGALLRFGQIFVTVKEHLAKGTADGVILGGQGDSTNPG